MTTDWNTPKKHPGRKTYRATTLTTDHESDKSQTTTRPCHACRRTATGMGQAHSTVANPPLGAELGIHLCTIHVHAQIGHRIAEYGAPRPTPLLKYNQTLRIITPCTPTHTARAQSQCTEHKPRALVLVAVATAETPLDVQDVIIASSAETLEKRELFYDTEISNSLFAPTLSVRVRCRRRSCEQGGVRSGLCLPLMGLMGAQVCYRPPLVVSSWLVPRPVIYLPCSPLLTCMSRPVALVLMLPV